MKSRQEIAKAPPFPSPGPVRAAVSGAIGQLTHWGALGIGALGIGMTLLAFWSHYRFLILDGSQVVSTLASPFNARPYWHHPLYFPLARAVASLGLTQLDALYWVSAGAAGLGISLVCWVTFRLYRSLGALLIALACTACSPALWYHARIIEVHTLQFLGAAVILAAVAVFSHRRATLSSGLLGVAIVLACLLHRSNAILALPVCLSTIRWDTRTPQPNSQATDNFSVRGIWIAVALALPLAVAGWRLGSPGDGRGEIQRSAWLVLHFFKGPSWRFVVDELLFSIPSVLVWPLALMARPLSGFSLTERYATISLASLTLFYLGFGEPSRGGYLLQASPSLAICLSSSWPRLQALLGTVAAKAMTLGLSVLLGLVAWTTNEPPYAAPLSEYLDNKRKAVAALRSDITGPICLVSCDPNGQVINGLWPDIYEVDLTITLMDALLGGASIETIVRENVAQLVAQARTYGQPVLLGHTGQQVDAWPELERTNTLLREAWQVQLGAKAHAIGQFEFLW